MAHTEALTKEIKAIIEKKNKETLEEIKNYLQSIQTEPERPSISEIPKEAKTIKEIDNLIRKYNLTERVLQGRQPIPKELKGFTVVAVIFKVLGTRDTDNNRPEKIQLRDQVGFYSIVLNNWNGYPSFLLKDLKGEIVILYDVSLSDTKYEFQKTDGKWILNWDGAFKILKGDDK